MDVAANLLPPVSKIETSLDTLQALDADVNRDHDTVGQAPILKQMAALGDHHESQRNRQDREQSGGGQYQ
jgi:hypothetical protein